MYKDKKNLMTVTTLLKTEMRHILLPVVLFWGLYTVSAQGILPYVDPAPTMEAGEAVDKFAIKLVAKIHGVPDGTELLYGSVDSRVKTDSKNPFSYSRFEQFSNTPGGTRYIAADYFFPETPSTDWRKGFPISTQNEEIVIFQKHSGAYNGKGGSPVISLNFEHDGTKPYLLMIRRWGSFVSGGRSSKKRILTPFPTGEWFRIIIEDKHSRQGTASKGVRLWIQRNIDKGYTAPQLIYSDTDPTMMEETVQYGNFYAVATYAWATSIGGTFTSSYVNGLKTLGITERVAYVDNIAFDHELVSKGVSEANILKIMGRLSDRPYEPLWECDAEEHTKYDENPTGLSYGSGIFVYNGVEVLSRINSGSKYIKIGPSSVSWANKQGGTSSNTAPAFTLSTSNVTDIEDFTAAKTVVVTPAAVPVAEQSQKVTYSLNPSTSSFANIVFDLATGRTTISALPNASGTQLFTVTANDGQVGNNLFTQTFTLNITPVNDPPVFTLSTSNLTVNEDFGGPVTVSVLPGAVPIDEAGQKVVYTLTPASIEFAALTFNTATGNVSFVSLPNKFGKQTFTLSANDGATNGVQSRTFVFEVLQDQACSLAPAWTKLDIGAVGFNGTACGTDNTITVQASGADIWDASDEFTFVHKTLKGDGEIFAKVTGLGYTHEFAKAGVMIRDKLTPNAQNALMYIGGGRFWSFQRRISAGDTTVSTKSAPLALTFPYWVRLVRKGNLIEGYVSSNGSQWNLVQSQTVVMSENVFVGLATTSHDDTKITTAGFENVTIKDYTENTPPVFTLNAYSIIENEDFAGTKSIVPVPATVPAAEVSQPLSYSLSPSTVAFANIVFDPKTGRVNITAKANASGSQAFTLVANDGQADNETYTQSFTLTIAPVNDPPIFSFDKNDLIVKEDFAGTLSVKVIPGTPAPDEASQKVTYTLSPKTVGFANINFNASTGEVQFTSVANTTGKQVFTVTASDGSTVNATFGRSFTFEVTPENDAPKFILNKSTIILPEDFGGSDIVTPTQVNVQSDEIAQNLRYSMSPLTASFVNISFDPITGKIIFTAKPNGVGKQVFTLVANDGQANNATYSQTFELTINPANDPPRFTLATNTLSLYKDFAPQSIALNPIAPPVDESSQAITYTVTPVAGKVLNVVYDAVSRSLQLSSKTGLAGTETFTITANDNQPTNNIFTQTLTVTVLPEFDPQDTKLPLPIRINAGSNAYTSPTGIQFISDRFFYGTGVQTQYPLSVANTIHDPLYATVRKGASFYYDIPVESGDYDVILHFNEPVWNQAGKRVFYAMCEKKQLVKIDIFQSVGQNSAYQSQIKRVKVTDGKLTLEFLKYIDEPILSGIEIHPASLTNTVPTFNLSPSSLVIKEKTSAVVDIQAEPVPAKETYQKPVYTVTRLSNNRVKATIDLSTGKLTVAADSGFVGTVEIDVTADDGFYNNNLFTRTLSVKVEKQPVNLPQPPTQPVTIRINAGGPALTTAAGKTFAAENPAQLSGKSNFTQVGGDILGTSEDLLYQTLRWSHDIKYNVAVPNGLYDISLHFVETYWAEAGKRVFDVFAEDFPYLSEVDLFQEFGYYRAGIKTIKSVSVSDGILNLNFLSSVDSAVVSAIEITNAISAIPQQTVRINAGGTTDVKVAGYTFLADRYYSANTVSFTNTSLLDVKNTGYDVLYLSERSSNVDGAGFSYDIPLANGAYKVYLHFAEIWWGVAGGAAANPVAGTRIFGLTAENQSVLSGLDIAGQAGIASALVKSFDVTVQDGMLNLNFAASVNRPQVSAIEILAPQEFGTSVSEIDPDAKRLFEDADMDFADKDKDPTQILLAPNPTAQGDVSLMVKSTWSGKFEVSISDGMGRKVKYYTFDKTNPSFKGVMDISSLTPGFYAVTLSYNGKPYSSKLWIRP